MPEITNSTKTMSRRNFLKIAGVSLGASSLACCGLGFVATQKPEVPKPGTPSYSYGKGATNLKRILVVYATRTGSTVGVASAIGETLSAGGFGVNVKPIKENPAIHGYDAILIGSAVNGGKWLPEAIEFVKNNQQALSKIPVAFFCVHIMNLGDDEQSTKNRLAYLANVRSIVKPVDEAYFAGLGTDPVKSSLLERWMNRIFKIGPEGDCRDWNKIRAWAKSLCLRFNSAARLDWELLSQAGG